MTRRDLLDAWHDADCFGWPSCDGCGWIDADLTWHSGPCPMKDRPHQRVRSELGEPYDTPLRLAPIGLRAACEWVADVHRHHKPPRGHKFSVAVKRGDELVGVAIAGRPLARMLDNGERLEVLRVAVREGEPNACSMLYGAVARAAAGMGYARHNVLTYILESEHGTSLKAAGWVKVADSDGGLWSRSARQRHDEVNTERKTRWHAAMPPEGDDQ